MAMTYMWALYAREVRRFQKIWLDTVLSPIVTMGLYLAVFGIAIGDRSLGQGTGYLPFVYAGLLTMVMVNSSFSNPSFALVIAKNVGSIMDLQVVPISPWQVGLAYAMSALTRGAVTLAIAIAATAWFIPGLHVAHPFLAAAALALTGMEFGMLGVTFGLWAKNFEALTFITTFVLQPMIFLAGVFYPVSNLPKPWDTISLFNPMHHNINLFRFALVGYADVAPWISALVVIALAAAMFLAMRYSAKRTIRS
jgi:ABC-2 type transport system permease protein